MATKFMQLVSTPSVRAAQEHFYGQHQSFPVTADSDRLGDFEREFIAARDSFYMATTNSEGWPYIQHRGGPRGFLQVLGPDRLAFADFKGNRQLLTTGNLARDDRVALFLTDYPQRMRLKILGHCRALDARDQTELADRLCPSPELRGRIERVFLIEVVGFDWNCPKYITPRYTADAIEEMVAPLRARIAELEKQLERGH